MKPFLVFEPFFKQKLMHVHLENGKSAKDAIRRVDDGHTQHSMYATLPELEWEEWHVRPSTSPAKDRAFLEGLSADFRSDWWIRGRYERCLDELKLSDL